MVSEVKGLFPPTIFSLPLIVSLPLRENPFLGLQLASMGLLEKESAPMPCPVTFSLLKVSIRGRSGRSATPKLCVPPVVPQAILGNKQGVSNYRNPLFILVGATGFEPATT